MEQSEIDYWAKRRQWMFFEAAHLAAGIEPPTDDAAWVPKEDAAQERGTTRRKIADFYRELKSAAELAQVEVTPAPIEGLDRRPWKRWRIEPWKLLAWTKQNGIEFCPELAAAIKAPEPAPTDPRQAAIPAIVAIDEAKWRAKLTPKMPEPKLPFQSWRELAKTFKEIQADGGAVNWEYEANQASKWPLQYVERTERRHTYFYNPEGVALWLHHEKGANARKIGRVMSKIFPIGSEWADKADYWGRVATGEETI